MCHDNSIIPNVYEITHNIKFRISSNKTQDMHTTTQTWQVPQSSQSRTTSTFLHDVSLRSVSNSKFWMPSRTLLSPSSLRDIWQQNELQTTNKTTCRPKTCHSVYPPPFKLTLGICAQPYRPFWKQQVNLELTKSTILLLPHQTNSGAFGAHLRGIPDGIRSSPLFGHTLAGQMPPYPSPGHGDQWVIHTECGP